MKGEDLIQEVAARLSDVDHVRWSETDVAGFVSRAMTWVVTVRPDANTVSEAVKLAAGAEQAVSSLVDGGLRLQGVERNLGADGATPGRHLRAVEKATMERVAPKWSVSKPGAEVRDVLYEPRRPDAFWCYPPVTADVDVWISILVSVEPTEVTVANKANDVDLTPEYREPVVNYATALALQRQTDAGSQELSNLLKQQAMQDLGLQAERRQA